jgi:hypothetical protein
MADIVRLTDGTTSIDLILDADGFQMLASGNQFGLPEHDNLYHESSWADGEELVQHKVKNRVWAMKLAVRGDTDDAVINTLIGFNRLVRQARRYKTHKDVDPVYLYIKLNSLTNATYYDVVDVKYNTLALLSYMNRTQEELLFDDGFSIEVETDPYGYGAEVTLANELGNPGFQEDGDSDDLADLWNSVGAPASIWLYTTDYLVGNQSQGLNTSVGGGDGIESDSLATSAAARTFVAYAWVNMGASSGTVTLTARNHTDSSSIDTDTLVSTSGWNRLSVSGTMPANKAGRLRITATGGIGFIVDKCYWQFGTTAIPTGWASCRYVKSHQDDDEGDINYIDIADIPGDVPAQTRITYNNSYDSGTTLLYTVFTSVREREDQFIDNILSDADITTWGGSRSVTTNAAYVDGQYTTVTLAAKSSWSIAAGWAIDPDDISEWGGKYMVLLCSRSLISADFDLRLMQRLGVLTSIATYPKVAGSGTKITELGIITMPPSYPTMSGNPQTFSVELQYMHAAGTTLEIDCLVLMPMDQYRIIRMTPSGSAYGQDIVDDGVDGWIHGEDSGSGRGFAVYLGLGDNIVLKPGAESRMFFVARGTEVWAAQRTLSVEIVYRPRTELILGTI